MAETLTEADSYTATMQMPTSGETVSAADLRDRAIQRLTDRTNYLYNRTQSYGTWFLGSSAEYNTTFFTLTEIQNTGEYTLSGSNLITFDSTGLYDVSFFGAYTSDQTTNPLTIGVAVLLSSSASYSSPTTALTASQTRFSATTTNRVGISGRRIVEITDTATEKLFIGNITSGSGIVSPVGAAAANELFIRKIT